MQFHKMPQLELCVVPWKSNFWKSNQNGLENQISVVFNRRQGVGKGLDPFQYVVDVLDKGARVYGVLLLIGLKQQGTTSINVLSCHNSYSRPNLDNFDCTV